MISATEIRLMADSYSDGGQHGVAEDLRHAASSVEALQAFKTYVHERLDAAGIPTHPEGPHSAKGCRIGDRLDMALKAREACQQICDRYEDVNLSHEAFRVGAMAVAVDALDDGSATAPASGDKA